MLSDERKTYLNMYAMLHRWIMDIIDTQFQT